MDKEKYFMDIVNGFLCIMIMILTLTIILDKIGIGYPALGKVFLTCKCMKKIGAPQKCQVHIELKAVERRDGEDTVWKYSLKDQNTSNKILYEIAKMNLKTDVYAALDIYENGTMVVENHILRVGENFLVSYLKDAVAVKSGLDLHYMKILLDRKERTDQYIIYYPIGYEYSKVVEKATDYFEYPQDATLIRDPEIENAFVIHMEKDENTVISEYVQRVIGQTDNAIERISENVASDLMSSKNEMRYPSLAGFISVINDRIKAGEKIMGISDNQWQIYRDEILVLLERDLTEKQQGEIASILARIKNNMYSPQAKKDDLDTDATIQAINTGIKINSYN